MKKHIKKFNNFINESNKITYSDECLGYHSGQTDMEAGIYENGKIIGVVQYTLFKNELTIKDINILPTRRREGFGSLLMNYIKKENPTYIYKPSLKTNLGSKFIHKKINESIGKKILYHGSLWNFDSFKPKISFFSGNPKFCYTYADTKSLDLGLDLDIIIYECEFTGTIFSYKNDEDMDKLISILPDKVKVNHGTAWFIDHDFDKQEMINKLKGFETIESVEHIKDANIGSEVHNPSYKSEIFIVVDRDEDNVYTIDKKTYKEYLIVSSIGSQNSYYSSYNDYTSIFEPWRQEVVNIYNKNKQTNKSLSEKFYYDFNRFKDTLDYCRAGHNIDYVSPYSDNKNLAFTKEDIEKIDKIYNECLENFNKVAYKELHRKEWNRKEIKVEMNSNWNYYENETIINLIKKLGYDGYLAKEKGYNTYAIFEPNKTIKILGKV